MAKKQKTEKESSQYKKNSDLLKKFLGLDYLKRIDIDAYSANRFLLKDIWKNQPHAGVHHLGYDDPQSIPFNPGAVDTDPNSTTSNEGYRAATSGSKYNAELLVPGEDMIEYDFKEAYTNIMRMYHLPSNTYLEKVKMTKEKLEKRFAEFDTQKHPYREMKTFCFIRFSIAATVKPGVYTERGSMLFTYGEDFTADDLILSEIELRMIFEYYDIIFFDVIDSYVYRTRKGMLDEYFDRIDKLKLIGEQAGDDELISLYKTMRNKIYGQIGINQIAANEKTFRFPMYNRAFSAAVAGVLRDMMIHYEQNYVNSEYGLVMIKTDGIYFKNTVPEFDKLAAAGIVRRKEHIIDSSVDKEWIGG